MNKLLLSLLILTLAVSCNNKQTTDTDGAETAVDAGYTFQSAFTTLKWTAFKTTAKVAVGGTFKAFEVIPGKTSGSLTDIMSGLTFTISTASSASENEERDGKIATFFYGKMLNTENITGEITSINGNDSSGTARIAIKMNDQVHEVDATYKLEGSTVTLNAHLILSDWKAEPAIQALNEVCNDLHKGEDGISKLWNEVDVVVTSTLASSAAPAG